MKTQEQMFYQESRKIGRMNELFLEMVEDGLTSGELKKLIQKRPEIWGRYSNWIESLPEKSLT